MRRSHLVTALVAAALGAAAPALGQSPVKAPDPIAAGAAVGTGDRVAFARVERGATPRLLVTFADLPRAAEVADRLAGLGPPAPALPEAGVWTVRPTRSGAARDDALARPQVVSAEWSLRRAGTARPAAKGDPPAYTDPLFTPASQWGLSSPGTTWGPDLTAAGPRPRIAILDSGIDRAHPEWAAPGLLVDPFSALGGDPTAGDGGLTGHGTHVAGIAAAPADGVGVVGVAPARGDAQVIPVQVADAYGDVEDADMISGIRWAVRHGARVVNISAGGPGYARALQETIDWAASQGAVVVAAVGNEGEDVNTLNYPAAYRRVIGVGAECDGGVTPECPAAYGVARFSNYNRSVDVIAPGVNILSTVPVRVRSGAVTPGYGLKDGTSMSTPYVTGVVALVQAAHGNALSPFQVLRQLQNTATDLPPAGRDPRSGHGLVNPRAAVSLPAPADDLDEVNDDIKWVGRDAGPAERRPPLALQASIDAVEDPDDVYAVDARRGDLVRATLTHDRGQLDLYLWDSRARSVRTSPANLRRNLLRFSGRKGARRQVVVQRIERSGRYYLDVYARAGRDDYRLDVVRRTP